MPVTRGINMRAILALAVLFAASGSDAGRSLMAVETFARLKALEGRWSATEEELAETELAPDDPLPAGAHHEFVVSAGGTVVIERMSAHTEQEMLNAYYMDGDDLVLTHYCVMGNQPTMKLTTVGLMENQAHFQFTGGDNLDVEVDQQIHSASLFWEDDGRVLSTWVVWAGGKQAAEVRIVLQRER